jgi:hypothetical protein
MKLQLFFAATFVLAKASALSPPANHPPVAWKPAGPNDGMRFDQFKRRIRETDLLQRGPHAPC